MLVVAEQEQLPVAQAKAGNAEAWDALFRRYQLPLYVYVCEIVRDEQASLDVVQETFINAARHIGSLQDDAKFGSWLFGIAHQRCVQLWRKSHCNAAFEAFSDELFESLATEDDGPADRLIHREEEARFLALLEQLPPAQRSVLLLHFIEDFSLEDISRITETSLGTVKSRMHYAKKALRQLAEENNL
jgi:RNA polymerase sigma-70 factor (ECF subfamily)